MTGKELDRVISAAFDAAKAAGVDETDEQKISHAVERLLLALAVPNGSNERMAENSNGKLVSMFDAMVDWVSWATREIESSNQNEQI